MNLGGNRMSINKIFLLFAFMGAVACSKAPKAYNSKTPAPPPVLLEKAAPTDQQYEKALLVEVNGQKVSAKDILQMPISTEDIEGGFAYDAKIKATSSLPILYKKGAGGITFDTTLEEAEAKLSRPRFGPDADGYAYYDEGLYILWRQDSPRTPLFIMAFPEYLGEIPMPAPLLPITMGFDFSRLGYKAKSLEGAQQIAIDYFRILENESSTYDCLVERTCLVDWGDESQKNFIFNIPGKMQWLISKDRFVIFRAMLLDPKPGIPFDFDILAGSMQIPNQGTVQLGQQYAQVEELVNTLLNIDPQIIKTSVGYDSFSRSYGSTAFAYQKTLFDRTSVQPLPSDKMTLIQVWSGYTNALTLGGRNIVVSETANGVDLRIAGPGEIQTLQETVDRRELPLQISLGLQGNNVRPFVEKLKDLIVVEMQATYPAATVVGRFVGAHQKRTIKDYSAYVIVYDKDANDGLFVQFGAEEQQGNLTSFTVLKLGGEYNPLDPIIFGEITSPMEKGVGSVEAISAVTGKPVTNPDGSKVMVQAKLPTFTELSGLAIGDLVEVTDWDLGRGEATLRIQKGIKKDEDIIYFFPPVRAGYSDRALINVAYSAEKDLPQDVAYANFGSLNIGVGLRLLDKQYSALTRVYKIVSVTSNLNTTKILDLCGQQFAPEFGMSSVKFLETLSKIPGCVYLSKNDTGGNGRLENVYFPNDRLRIGFDEEEMVSATIYAPNNEVQ
jgi:hypothetical protein